MAGSHIEITLDNQAVQQSLAQAIVAMKNPRPLLVNLREYLLRTHHHRFAAQRAPDGTPWQPLQPRYQARKKYNPDRILVLRGYLKDLLRGEVDDQGLSFGTDRPYGAIHQFGGPTGRGGKTQMPARPWLGLSPEDEDYLLDLTRYYLANAL